MYRKPLLHPLDMSVLVACCDSSANGSCGSPPPPREEPPPPNDPSLPPIPSIEDIPQPVPLWGGCSGWVSALLCKLG